MEYYIYTLTNPINNKIFYVGKCINLKMRLSSHISESKNMNSQKNIIIKEILSNGLLPIIEEIDTIIVNELLDNEIVHDSEYYWIHQLNYWGFELTNVIGKYKKPKTTNIKVHNDSDSNKKKDVLTSIRFYSDDLDFIKNKLKEKSAQKVVNRLFEIYLNEHKYKDEEANLFFKSMF